MRYVEKKQVVVAGQLRDDNDMAFLKFLLDNNIHFDYSYSSDVMPTQRPVTIYYHERDSGGILRQISRDVNPTEYVVVIYRPNEPKLIRVLTDSEFNKKYEVDSNED